MLTKVWLVLTFLLLVLAPWKLMALGIEALWMHPGNVRMNAGGDQYWDVKDLESRLKRFGWKITYRDKLIEEENVYGMTEPVTREITIDAGLSWNERYSVLLHEAAHTLHPWRMSNQEAEVFAESVSAIVDPQGFGEHARYLASLKPEIIPVMVIYWREIYRTADILEE